MERRPGYYLGTEIGERWWRRYRGKGFFARGRGEYWFEEKALCFLKFMTSLPLRIPYRVIKRVELGTSHAGKWIFGRTIVKIIWQEDGQVLSSGFVFSRSTEGTELFIEPLKKHIHDIAPPHWSNTGAFPFAGALRHSSG